CPPSLKSRTEVSSVTSLYPPLFCPPSLKSRTEVSSITSLYPPLFCPPSLKSRTEVSSITSLYPPLFCPPSFWSQQQDNTFNPGANRTKDEFGASFSPLRYPESILFDTLKCSDDF
ncbi:hypothetical protein RRG08_006095, partial [Elysia crispata]